MKLILGFVYKESNYYIVDDGNKIFLGKYENNVFIVIPDSEKVELRNLIKLLLGNKLDKKALAEYNLSTLNTKSFQLAGGLNNAIILELPNKLRKNFNRNCKALSNEKTNKMIKTILMILPIIAVVGVVIYYLIGVVMDNVAKENAAKALLEKYTYVEDSSLSKFYSMNFETVNITNKIGVGLFEDEFVNFENPYDSSLFSTHFDISFRMNKYLGQADLDIIYYATPDFSDYNFADLNSKYSVSVENVLTKNNVKTRVDLVNRIYDNDSKKITTKSNEAEMIEHYVFDIIKPVAIPFDNESNTNEILIFKGDKIGYAHITDNEVDIVLEANEMEYELVFKYTNSEVPKLTREQIINIVSTLKFN